NGSGPTDHVSGCESMSVGPERAVRGMFWVSAAVIGYAYVGYPLWLWLRSWWSPWPVLRGPGLPAVSAVMVVRNEESAIARKLENLLTLDYPHEMLEVVTVSDGSSDGTEMILAEF